MNLLFFDFDGTLRVPQTNQVSKKTIESLHKLRKKGDLVFINTGRCYSSLEVQLHGVPVDGVICGCGTLISYHDTIVYRADASINQRQKVLEALRKYRVDAFLEGHEDLYCDRTYSDRLDKVTQFFERVNVLMKNVEDPHFSFSKMSLYYESEEQKQAFEKSLEKDFDFIHFPNLKSEAVLKSHSKATGMRKIATLLDFPIEKCIAFGDSDNDSDMLLAANQSVLIGENAPHLKDIVSLQAPCAKEEGVTWALKKLKLID